MSSPFNENRLDVEVEIAGEDKICYGGYQPEKKILGENGEEIHSRCRVKQSCSISGRLSYASYESGSKGVGATFTSPSICLQLSLLESACDIRIVASNSPPVTGSADQQKAWNWLITITY